MYDSGMFEQTKTNMFWCTLIKSLYNWDVVHINNVNVITKLEYTIVYVVCTNMY